MLIDFMGMQVTIKTNFLGYTYGGCQIKLRVPTDYSQSNLGETSAANLHAFSKNFKQDLYLRAIKSAVTIMQYYNTSERIIAYGCVGKVGQSHEASGCFALTGDISNPKDNGIDDLIEAYKKTLDQKELGLHAHIASIIKTVNLQTEYGEGNIAVEQEHYHIPIVLTYGEI